MASRYNDRRSYSGGGRWSNSGGASDGGTWARGQKIDLPTPMAVKNEIQQGRYKIVYDGKGIQEASSSNSNPDSTWYSFDVLTIDGDKVIGFYHVHPKGKNFWSGNLKVPHGSSGQSACIGRATDWQWLCDEVVSQIK